MKEAAAAVWEDMVLYVNSPNMVLYANNPIKREICITLCDQNVKPFCKALAQIIKERREVEVLPDATAICDYFAQRRGYPRLSISRMPYSGKRFLTRHDSHERTINHIDSGITLEYVKKVQVLFFLAGSILTAGLACLGFAVFYQ